MVDSKARNKTPIVDSTEQVMKRQTVFMRFGGSQVKQLCHYIEITCCGGPAVLNGNKKIGSGYPQVAYDKPSLASMDGAMVGLGGNGPPNFFLNIIKYMDTNFSNFVLKNCTFVPLKISLILLRALL